MGSAFAGALRRRSSLEWNDHTALLPSCIASRKERFAAMRIVETGSDRQDFFEILFFEDFAFFFDAAFLATFFFAVVFRASGFADAFCAAGFAVAVLVIGAALLAARPTSSGAKSSTASKFITFS